jgi:hypothetical protein
MDDGLLLLLQQGDDAALRPDGAVQAVGGPGEEAGYGGLFLQWDQWKCNPAEVAEVEILSVPDEIRCGSQSINVLMRLEEMLEVAG